MKHIARRRLLAFAAAAALGLAGTVGVSAVALASANDDCGAYCSTSDGSPSLNGNGNGNANGLPCAGCVGNADNKNPPGQAPDGSDPNSGYECDENNGVGKTNPAHSGCAPEPTPTPDPTHTPGGWEG